LANPDVDGLLAREQPHPTWTILSRVTRLRIVHVTRRVETEDASLHAHGA